MIPTRGVLMFEAIIIKQAAVFGIAQPKKERKKERKKKNKRPTRGGVVFGVRRVSDYLSSLIDLNDYTRKDIGCTQRDDGPKEVRQPSSKNYTKRQLNFLW